MKASSVVYVDPFGQEHDALVTAENGLHPGYVSLVYVDVAAPEAENVKKLYDIPHVSGVAAEPNPALPTYQINCWKDFDEDHNAPPADHPSFDHPFASQVDAMHKQLGIDAPPVTPQERPEFEAHIEAHQGQPSAGDLDAVAAEQKAAEATDPDVATQLDAAPPAPEAEADPTGTP